MTGREHRIYDFSEGERNKGTKLSFLSGNRKLKYAIAALVAVQAFFSLLFLYDLLQSLFSLRAEPLSWEMHEALELAGVLGLLLGFLLGIMVLRKVRQEVNDVSSRLRVASQGFFDLVQDEFTRWQLSPSERDIAMYILKGMSNAEIADMTGKKQGTIKAQCNAVFRKTGLSNRSQFTSYFIEILMQEPLNDRKKAAE